MSIISDDERIKKELITTQKEENNIVRTAKDFQREELQEYCADLEEVKCQLLDTGIIPVHARYYICECDPERSNPICEKCFKQCHFNGLKFPHKEIKNDDKVAVCICGYKSHKPLNVSEQADNHYSIPCTFGEVGQCSELNFYYQNQDESITNICLLCYNICHSTDEKFIKKPLEDLKGFQCACETHNHTDIRIIFRKLRSLAKKNNFLKLYNFEGLSFLHFVNILTATKHTFYNLFHSFMEKLSEIAKNLETNPAYAFEDHNVMGSLHLTAQVFLVFAIKCKNVYKIENKIMKKKLTDEENSEGQEEEDVVAKKNDEPIGVAGAEIENIKVRVKNLCYYNDVIKDIINEKLFFKIMQRKFDCKSRNIWQLKYYIITIFYKFYIEKDFAAYPNFKVNDLLLLSPLQRTLMISSIESEAKVNHYINNLNCNYLNQTLKCMELLINSQEKSETLTLILRIYYKMCLKFAKFSLFNHEQVNKLCQLNDQVITMFDEDKQNSEEDFLKLKVLSPMVKILLFLVYYYNDQLVMSGLKGERSISNLTFFHGKNEISRCISMNVILILNFIKRIPEESIKMQNNIEKKITNKVVDPNNKIQELLPQKPNYIHCLRNIINNCSTILNINLNIEEEYRSGIVRLIDEEQIILYDYYRGNLLSKEKEFLGKCRYFSEQLENSYYNYFQNSNSLPNEEKFVQKFEDIITEFDKHFVPMSYNKKEKIIEEEEDKLIKKEDDEAKNDGEDEGENDVKSAENNSRYAMGFNNKYLVINSFFLQSMVKFVHIMYSSHTSKKMKPEKFMIKPLIFKSMMEILYNFIYKSQENSIFLLQTDFTTNFELLNEDQLLQAVGLLDTALQIVAEGKREIVSHKSLIHFLKVAILKSGKTEVLNEILKLIKTMAMDAVFLHENIVQKKLMKLIKIIFNYHTIVKDYFTLMNSSKKSDRLQCFKLETELIVKKFMRIINRLSTQKVMIEEKEFLDMIVSKDQLKKILYTKTINISLRTELIIYYRKNFLEVVLTDKKDAKYYGSALINDFKPRKSDEIIENPKYYKFLEFLVKSGDYTGEIGLEKDANMVKFELLNFQEVLTMTTKKDKIRYYIESIVKCVMCYFSKFSSCIFDSSGYNCLSLYEIVYYFLALKKYIYTRTEVFVNKDDERRKILFKKKLCRKTKTDHPIINPVETNEKEMLMKGKKDFATRFLIKEKKRVRNPKTEEQRIECDLSILSEESYEFLNYAALRKIFLRHTENFIVFPRVKGMKEYLEKKAVLIDDNKYKKYQKYLKDKGRYNKQYTRDALDIIVNYLNLNGKMENNSFIKVLDDTHAHYNTSYRLLLIKIIIHFYNGFEFKNYKYRWIGRWFMFRLLQFNTAEVQNVYNDLEAQNTGDYPIYNFNDNVDEFTSNMVTVILREINYNGFENMDEYFDACMNIKILKYFCEEHNSHFQSFFFNKIKDNKKTVLVHYCPELRTKKKFRKLSDAERTLYKKNKENKDKADSGSESSSKHAFGTMYNKKASVFEYFLRVLGKIILLSHWMNNKEPDYYFYDIYFIIIEFLIETIQGTTRHNIKQIFVGEKRGKSLFEKFLSEVNHLLIDDNSNSQLSYVIRKDMMDFIMAFLEESATPPSGIIDISSTILPATILDSIIASLCNYYEDATNENDDEKHKKKDKFFEDKEDNLYVKKNYKFTKEMLDFFKDCYFNNSELIDDEKFALANRMYQYFKMLGQQTGYKNAYVADFYFKYDMFTLDQVVKSYYNKTFKLINTVTNAAITEAKFNEQYLCVNFFESITRTVLVRKEDEEGEVGVIFTLNPNVPLLSTISKDDFIDNVDRTDRYSKLVSLLDRCDNFFEEIKYRQRSGQGNCFKKVVNSINFYILEVIAFFITLSINLIMLVVLKGPGDSIYEDHTINSLLKDLGYANAIFNFICIVLWLFAKFNLLYMTECQIMIKSYRELNDDDGDEKEITLSTSDKLNAAFIVLIKKNKLFAFFWNIVLSLVGAFTGIYFIYIIQIFIIFNLSITLRNLIFSITLKGRELASVFYFSVVVNLCLAAIAFYYFEEDFTKAIDSKVPHYYPEGFDFLNDLIGGVKTEQAQIESECGTFAYCLATHMDYGMRFDGGIADRMTWRSYNINKSIYIARFFYETVYFWAQTVMLQGMVFSIVIEAFSQLRNKEQAIQTDKKDICFICGIDKVSCEKNGQKFEEHCTKVHNLWTYVDYILGLRFVDIQETNAVNSYVMEKIVKKELIWFPFYKGNSKDTQNEEEEKD